MVRDLKSTVHHPVLSQLPILVARVHPEIRLNSSIQYVRRQNSPARKTIHSPAVQRKA
jgi:hypothetical protein